MWRLVFLFFLSLSTLFAAQFKEYYRTNDAQPPKEQPSATLQTKPAQTQNQFATPTLRKRTVDKLPSFYFGWTGNHIVRLSAGFVKQSRDVKVKTTNSGDDVYYKPKNHLMGSADGSTLSYTANDLFFRPQIGYGYQLAFDGNFWTVDYYKTNNISELLFNYSVTFPKRRIASAIPYVKGIAGIGYVDSEGFSPTSLSFGVGVGAYHYLDKKLKTRIEYGIDYTMREWLGIDHSYGKEEWSDQEAHLYIGIVYRFD